MAKAELGGGPPGFYPDGGLVSSRTKRLMAARWIVARELPWIALCAALIAVGIAIAAVGRPQVTGDGSHARKEPAPAAQSTGTSPEPSGTQQVGPSHGAGLVTKGVTIQVLNATGRGKGDNLTIARLRKLGYSVVAVHLAVKTYSRTTVFWSRAEGKPAARALADRNGWIVRHKPRNLSASVTMHVVVGRDESARRA